MTGSNSEWRTGTVQTEELAVLEDIYPSNDHFRIKLAMCTNQTLNA